MASEPRPSQGDRPQLHPQGAAFGAPTAPAATLTALPAPRTLAVVIAPTAVQAATYSVQPGDTIWGIASAHGLRTADVLAANSLTAASTIYPGQVLTLSAAASSTPAAAPVAPAAPAPSGATHTVAAGDTVSGVAKKYGSSTAAVLSANGLSGASIIYPGQTLAIPASGGAASAPVAAAPVAHSVPAAPVAAPTPSGGSHTVGAGDTVSAIAKRHGTTTQAVLNANGLTGASIIYPGQTLAIPGVASSTPAVATAPVTPATLPAPAPALSATLDAEQEANAKIIIAVGRQAGVPDRGIAIALATAMVESWMLNLSWGDRDSLGLFQQRPSSGWGTEAQITDPVRSTQVFYGGQGDPNGRNTRGLLDISGWQNMGFSEAAQAVQISAFPDRYGQWETAAYQWLATHG